MRITAPSSATADTVVLAAVQETQLSKLTESAADVTHGRSNTDADSLDIARAVALVESENDEDPNPEKTIPLTPIPAQEPSSPSGGQLGYDASQGAPLFLSLVIIDHQEVPPSQVIDSALDI